MDFNVIIAGRIARTEQELMAARAERFGQMIELRREGGLNLRAIVARVAALFSGTSARPASRETEVAGAA